MLERLKRPLATLLAFTFLASVAPAASAQKSDDVLRATLPNGLRVVIVRNPLAPVATEVMNYLVGGQNTPAGFPGMAHAEEHMVWGRDLAGVSTSQIASISTLLGGDADADTQTSVTQYFATVPSQYLDVALHLDAARMKGALDLQSDWVQERGAIEQEVSGDLSGAFRRYYEKALATLYAGTPYAQEPLGTRASFDKTTGPMLKHFFDTWYAPNNAILVIAGNVDPQATLATVRELFGPIARHAVPPQPVVKVGPLPQNTIIKDDSDYPVPFVLLTYRMPGYRDPDYYAADVAMDVLASDRGALAALAYDGKALGAGVEYIPSPQAGLAYAYIVTAPNADTNAALGTLGDVVAAYQKDGVPADLVEAEKKREIAQELFSRNSIEGLAMDWSQALAVQGLQSPDDVIAHYRSVTTGDVNRVLRRYFTRDRAVVGILTPKPGAVPSNSASSGVKDTFSATDAKPVPLPSWAAQLQTIAVPALQYTPSDVTLANGIRLIVQPLSVSPTVTVRGEIRNNPFLQTPPGKDGVGAVLGGLFAYGTTTYDRVAFATQLDDIAADVSAGTSFSLDVPSESFDRGMQLLADDLLHPALPPAAFAIVQSQSAQGLSGEMKSPDYLTQRALSSALLPKDDPALRQATPESISSLTLDDAKNYLASVYRPDETTIVIAGDVTADQAKATVEKYFGAWIATGPKPETQLPPIPLNAPSTVAVTAPGRVQTSVTLRENLGITRSDPEYYSLQLGNQVLGGSFYSTRFYRDLRRTSGLVYYVGASLSAGKTRASYSVEYGCDPPNVDKARAIINRELTDMAQRNVTAEELSSAKTQIVRDLALSESSVGAITGGLVSLSNAQLPLDEPTRRANAIVKTDADQVRAAFAKWIDPSRFVQVNEGPAK